MLAEYELPLQGFWSAPMRGHLETELERLKEHLLTPIIQPLTDGTLIKEVAWAANEAAAVAWTTICPLLVLPALLEEKICNVLKRWERQERLRRRSYRL